MENKINFSIFLLKISRVGYDLFFIQIKFSILKDLNNKSSFLILSFTHEIFLYTKLHADTNTVVYNTMADFVLKTLMTYISSIPILKYIPLDW